tara:strand:- start:338 stop:550 length:213 start_codon:yes stop_codon:yes gene_type:complete
MSQKLRVLEHFESGNTITSLEAYDQLGITQLATRIFELRQQGYPIEARRIDVKNRFGEECAVCEYYLEGA